MTSDRNNTIFRKNILFFKVAIARLIKELYSKYLNNPKSIPQSWIVFFDGLNEDQEIIKKKYWDRVGVPVKK